jgi:hypothetical protein
VARPGTQIIERSTPPPRSAPTDTGPWFVAGFTERGPVSPLRLDGTLLTIGSLTDKRRIFGGFASSDATLDTALEFFFRNGGSIAVINRVTGPTPTTSTRNLLDGSAGVSLVAKAKGPGAYGNSITVQVFNPGAGGTASSFSLRVIDPNYAGGSLQEDSPDFTTQAAAIAWSASSSLIDLTLGASALLPATLAASVLGNTTTGADDRANATDATWKAALDRAGRELGPGQVTQVGRTTAQAYADTISHAAATNRIAVLDGADTATSATLKAATVALKSNSNASKGGYFAPWLQMPALVAGGALRDVPPSAAAAAAMAANDVARSPNQPAAGLNGQLLFTSGVKNNWDDATRTDLNANGVNVIRSIRGIVQIYGFRTLSDPVVDPDRIWLANSRLFMAIQAKADARAEAFVLSQNDAPTRARFQGQLIGEILPYTLPGGGVYPLVDAEGNQLDPGYVVDVGPQVNTPTTIAAGEMHAEIAIRPTPTAELVVIGIARARIGQGF